MQSSHVFAPLGAIPTTATPAEAIAHTGAPATTITAILGAYARDQLAGALRAQGSTALATLIEAAPLDYNVTGAMSLRDAALRAVATASDVTPEQRAALAAAAHDLSATTTVAQIAKADTPIERHPAFHVEVERAHFASLIATGGIEPTLQERFLTLYERHDGSPADFWAALRAEPGFTPQVVATLQRTMQLGELTLHNIPLVARLQQTLAQSASPSVRALTTLDTQRWQALLTANGATAIPIPSGITGATDDARRAQYINLLQRALRQAFPTDYVAHAMEAAPTIDFALIAATMASNPHLDPTRPLPTTISWGNLTADQQQRARAAFAALRREVLMFPATDYRGQIAQAARSAQPTPAITTPRSDLARFFANAPDFDLRTGHVDAFIAQRRSRVFTGVANPTNTIRVLKRLQRVFQVTPDEAAITSLLGAGFDSAYRVARMPREQFVAAVASDLGGAQRARDIHAAAHHVMGQALTIFGHMANSTRGTGVAVIEQGTLPAPFTSTNAGPAMPPKAGFGGSTPTADPLPNWQELFGDVALCDCEECHSVYSPAAYFVDLLDMLDNATASTGNNALDALTKRRPDLRKIPLTCENTNTPIPYIDLVNEIMETYIVNNYPALSASPLLAPVENSLGVTGDELSLNPEHINQDAYTYLRENAIFPLSLPFDADLATARAYLNFMGTSRYEVMQTYSGQKAPPSDLAQACESLGLSRRQHYILTGADFPEAATLTPTSYPTFQEYQLYGYTSAPEQVSGLPNLAQFTQRTGLTVTEVEMMLKTRYVNPYRPRALFPAPPPLSSLDPNALVISAPASTSDPAAFTIQFVSGAPLDGSTASRAQRFIRLWRTLGWTMREVDQALATFGFSATSSTQQWPPSLLTDDLLVKLAAVKRIVSTLKISVASALTFWGSIDTAIFDDPTRDDSFYATLFQNKKVLNPPDTAFQLDTTHTALSGAPTLDNDGAAIMAALRLTGPELATLAQGLNITSAQSLTLADLSKLYRYAALARALRLKVAEPQNLQALWEHDPFADPASTELFIKIVAQVKAAGFTVTQLNYILRNVSDPAAPLAPLDDDIATFLTNLRVGLLKNDTATTLASDPDGNLTKTSLSVLLGADLATQAVGLLNGTAAITAKFTGVMPALTGLPAALSSRITYDPAGKTLQITGPLSSTDQSQLSGLGGADFQSAVGTIYQQPRDFIARNFANFISNTNAATAYLFDTSGVAPQDHFAYVLRYLLPYLRRYENSALVKQRVAQVFKLSVPTADLLLSSLISSRMYQPSAGLHALDDFLALDTTGLRATYYLAPSSTPQGYNIMPAINGDWSTTPPYAGLTSSAEYSITWTGKLQAPTSGAYAFTVTADNSVRVRLDDQEIIPAVAVPAPVTTRSSSPVTLTAGQWYNLRVDYYHKPGPTASVQLAWSTAAMLQQPIPTDALQPPYLQLVGDTYRVLKRAALLVKPFALTPKELTYVSAHPANFNGFNLDTLPKDGTAYATLPKDSSGTPQPFAMWRQVADQVALRNALPTGNTDLIDLFALAASRPANVIADAAMIASVTGWNIAQTTTLTGASYFNLTNGALVNAMILVEAQRCFALGQRIGLDAAHLARWSTATTPDPQDVINTVKANYDDTTWAEVAKPLNDTLREQRQAAMIALLTTNQAITQGQTFVDADALFEYFLIDVEMSACMETSRIKQAISSVQLYVQRVTLNLENLYTGALSDRNIPPSAIDASSWAWMKNYRVWEANRQVLLYPENWVAPELRKDKTPFFKDLESKLMQQAITADNVEQALREYLVKLDRVARLDVRAMYWEYDQQTDALTGLPATGVVDRLHVFARSLHPPYTYYYRRLENGATWTPWEEVKLDIHSDHLIPVVWNRRLHLFWAIFTPKPDANQAIPSANNQGATATQHYEISLAWSEYHDGAWAPKQTPTVTLDTPSDPSATETHANGLMDTSQVAFKATIDPGDDTLHIAVRQNALGNYYIGDFIFDADERTVSAQSRYNTQPGDSSYDGLMFIPQDHAIDAMAQAATDGAEAFHVITGDPSYDDSTTDEVLALQKHIVTLEPLNRLGAGPFTQPYPHQYSQFLLQAPFFYQDASRVYFVAPFIPWYIHIRLYDPNLVATTFQIKQVPGVIDYVPPQTVGPVNPGDPPIFEPGVVQRAQASTVATDVAATQMFQQRQVGFIAPGQTPQGPVGMAFGGAGDFAMRQIPSTVTQNITQDKGGIISQKSGAIGPIIISGVHLWNPPPPLWAAVHSDHEVDIDANQARYLPGTKMSFQSFFHPHTTALIRSLNWNGLPGVLTLCNQQRDDTVTQCGQAPNLSDTPTIFNQTYQPTATIVTSPYPRENIDFTPGGAYAMYNWELFFHVPMFIAKKLMNERKFDDAQKWLHFIFDPTITSDDPSPRRYWKVRPFYENAGATLQINQMLGALDAPGSAPGDVTAEKQEFQREIDTWMANPFDPHAVARLRISAYQKAVVMLYLDNLIAWGDQLFQQDTIETINQATQLYVLASHILGPQPPDMPARGTVEKKTFDDLRVTHLDQLGNAVVALQDTFPFTSGASASASTGDDFAAALGVGNTLYFCAMPNTKLQQYWSTVSDRLYKIRHCENIQGQYQQLPLFEPPLDPGALIAALAAGIDMGSLMGFTLTTVPPYRFDYVLKKAHDFASDVKALGAALQAALEKSDAEALAQLRATHDTAMQQALLQVSMKKLTAASDKATELMAAKMVPDIKKAYYLGLIGDGLLPEEATALTAQMYAAEFKAGAAALHTGAAAAHLVVEFDTGASGWAGSPVVKVKIGGPNFGHSANNAAKVLTVLADIADGVAKASDTMGKWRRRDQEWQDHFDVATAESAHIQAQIETANAVVAQATSELAAQQLRATQAQETLDFLTNKFTNEDLYTWMVGEISATYFQAYNLALQMARAAEALYRFERGVTTSSYIQAGYWDSLHQGLLAADNLLLDLRRMESDYMNQNVRSYEVTKAVSLAQTAPDALVRLQQTGACVFTLPETIFDIDYPGQYKRRIKTLTVNLAVPAGTLPTTVNATLTLLNNLARVSTTATSATDYPYQGMTDTRFLSLAVPATAIATSTAVNDHGMFVVDFFKDQRYFPFEGAGAISQWKLAMPQTANNFDMATINDIVLNVSYTAYEGGSAFGAIAQSAAQAATRTMLLSVRKSFASAWSAFVSGGGTSTTLTGALSASLFPYHYGQAAITVTDVEVFGVLPAGSTGSGSYPLTLTLAASASSPMSMTMSFDPTLKLYHADGATGDTSGGNVGDMTLSFTSVPAGLTDLLLVVQYVCQ